MLNQPLQLLIRLRSDHEVASGEKSRHGVDADRGATAPVIVNGSFEAATHKNVGGFVSRKAYFFGDLQEGLHLADIFHIDKIGAEERRVNLVTLSFVFGPF